MKSTKKLFILGVMSVLSVNAIMFAHALNSNKSKNSTEHEYNVIDVSKIITEYEINENKIKERKIIDMIVEISDGKITSEQAEEIYDSVKINADEYGFEESLILGMIAQESHFNSYAKSKCNAIGLMQITEIALNDYNSYNEIKYIMSDMYDVGINIKVGCWILNQMKKYLHSGIIKECVIAYNSGAYNFKKNKQEYLTKHNYEIKVNEFKSRFETL